MGSFCPKLFAYHKINGGRVVTFKSEEEKESYIDLLIKLKLYEFRLQTLDNAIDELDSSIQHLDKTLSSSIEDLHNKIGAGIDNIDSIDTRFDKKLNLITGMLVSCVAIPVALIGILVALHFLKLI